MLKDIDDKTAAFFLAVGLSLVLFGCGEKNWTTNPGEYLTPQVDKAYSVETATIGVIIEK